MRNNSLYKKQIDVCQVTGKQAAMAPRLGIFLLWAGVSVFLPLDPVNGGEGGEMGWN